MKKFLAIIAIILSLTVLCSGCFRKTAKGKNARINYTGTASVTFYPVCPKCGHVSPLLSLNLSDGEHEQGTYVCEKCWEVYTILIDRR
jgi:hypothetical protein